MENIQQELSAPLDSRAITKHPTKTYISSIKAIYVTERFNDVFGVGKWRTRVNEVSCDNETGMVIVKVAFSVPALDIFYESYGGNDNGGKKSKNFDLGDAYKGATTDAITKIGSYLGVGIDVFKGLSNPSSAQRPSTPSAKKELLQSDSKKFESAQRFLLSGGRIEEIEAKYLIEPKTREKLINNNK